MENLQPFSEQLAATAPPETKIFSRWKAAGIHLGISVFIALAVVAATANHPFNELRLFFGKREGHVRKVAN